MATCARGRRDRRAPRLWLDQRRVVDLRERRGFLDDARGAAAADRGPRPYIEQTNPSLRARRPRLERIAEILGLASHLSIKELHDAHGVRPPPVIGQDIFSDPEAARADYPPQCEAFPVWLRGARRLNLPPA